MKKLLILILIGLLVILSIFIAVRGFEIGNVEILSYRGIQQRSEELDQIIQQSSKLAETDFKKAVSDVENNSKELAKAKQDYMDMTTISTEGDVQSANHIDRYEVETLWVKLGNYATSEGAIIKMDIIKGNNTTTNTYNLRFTVTGSYISITDFISDIENDSTLGFRIEEFKMLPGEGTNLQATFVCKDIAIKEVSEPTPTTTDENTEATNTTNTTNTANTTNSTNTNATNNTQNNTNVAQ